MENRCQYYGWFFLEGIIPDALQAERLHETDIVINIIVHRSLHFFGQGLIGGSIYIYPLHLHHIPI